MSETELEDLLKRSESLGRKNLIIELQDWYLKNISNKDFEDSFYKKLKGLSSEE